MQHFVKGVAKPLEEYLIFVAVICMLWHRHTFPVCVLSFDSCSSNSVTCMAEHSLFMYRFGKSAVYGTYDHSQPSVYNTYTLFALSWPPKITCDSQINGKCYCSGTCTD